MSAIKDQDPDYGSSVANNEKHQRIYEENARTSTSRKITAIIEKEFSKEISNKEKEVLEIQEKLQRASKSLHLLRYVIVTDFYNRKQCQASQSGESRQTQIHPAIKQLIGKSTDSYDGPASSKNGSYFPSFQTQSDSVKPTEDPTDSRNVGKRTLRNDETPRPTKVPRYVPPRSGVPEAPCPSRATRHKTRKRIIIGNISKWIPPEWREDAASHKWTMYVRGNKENPDIDDFVGKVRFFLHPSYRPHDVVEVNSAPFCLSRRGWGEFPLRVQLHFKSALNKPMDIIHHLKLDRTYTGLQTLGSETLVDIWIYADSRNYKRNKTDVNCDGNAFGEPAAGNDARLKNELASPLLETEAATTSDVTSRSTHEESAEIADFRINAASENVDRLLFHVNLDHDYVRTKYSSESQEKNLTIRHSSGESKFADLPAKVKLERDDEIVGKNVNAKETFPNEAPSLGETERKVKTEVVDWKPEDGRTGSLPLRNGSVPSPSKPQPNFRPLQISIPPLFESSGSKRVLVVQNNKTIPVDIALPRSDESVSSKASAGSSARPKISLSITRGGVSLLKKPLPSSDSQSGNSGTCLRLKPAWLLNVNSNVPALKIADATNTPSYPPSAAREPVERCSKDDQEESRDAKVAKPKITLGKDKHRLQSKKDMYDEVFRTIEGVKISDIPGLLRFIVKRLPMVTRNASDPDYRKLHPYACLSEQEFFRYGVAKQRACEWNRAKITRSLLARKSLREELWTVKEILIWARLHGFTPVCSSLAVRQPETCGAKNLPDSTNVATMSTCTEPAAFHKWARLCPEQPDLSDAGVQRVDELDVVDVLEVDDVDGKLAGRTKSKANSLAKMNRSRDTGTEVTVLELDEKLIPLHDFVCETAKEIGVNLFASEEIIPTVVHCGASRVMMQAVECFVDDLVRRSLAKAWERYNDNGYPKVIGFDDVRQALLSREEFDIFTNDGLGSKYRFAVMN